MIATPKIDPEALDAAMRISNLHTHLGHLPALHEMAEVISDCYAPTLAKRTASSVREQRMENVLRHLRTCFLRQRDFERGVNPSSCEQHKIHADLCELAIDPNSNLNLIPTEDDLIVFPNHHDEKRMRAWANHRVTEQLLLCAEQEIPL